MVTTRTIRVILAALLIALMIPLGTGTASFGADIGTGGNPGGGGGGGNSGGGGRVDPGNNGPPRDYQDPPGGWKNPGADDDVTNTPCGSELGDLRSQCRFTTRTTHSAGGGCPARSGPGAQGGQNIGYTQRIGESRHARTENGTVIGPWSPWRELNRATVACYYAESWDDATLHCIESSVITIDKVAPNSKRMASKSQSTAFAGNRTIQNCLNSGQYISLGVEIDEFGRFLAEGTTLGRNCTARYYRSSNDLTGARPADTIVSCGGLYTVHNATDRLQIDCVNGVSQGFVNPAEFTAQACLDRDSAQAHCSVGGDPLFNNTARSNNVEAFRNGEENTIRWDPVNIEGSNVVNQRVTATTLDRSGTPWDKKVGAGSNRQVAYVEHNGKNAIGTKINSNARTFEAGFYKASDGGKGNRFTLQPTYDLDVTLRSESAIITGYDPFDGLDYGTGSMTYATTGDCTAEAINIDVLRSVNG